MEEFLFLLLLFCSVVLVEMNSRKRSTGLGRVDSTSEGINGAKTPRCMVRIKRSRGGERWWSIHEVIRHLGTFILYVSI